MTDPMHLVRCGLLLVLVAAAGCESKAYKELYQEKVALEIEHARVIEQMNEVWQQSLKARFPLIRPIEAGKPADVDLHYIKRITLRPTEHYNDRYDATIEYEAQADDTQPNFVLYLFDERGLNVARHRVKPGTFGSKKMKQGEKKTEQIEKIKVEIVEHADEVRFFWIRFVR